MPASHILLSSFIAEACGSVSGKAVRNWINRVRLWHIFSNAEWHSGYSWVSSLKKTADKEDIIFQKLPQNPFTIKYLHALQKVLSLLKPLHAAIWAVAVIAFWACWHLGESFAKADGHLTHLTDVSRATHISFYSVNG